MSTLPLVDVAQIAKVCHEANRAFSETIGELAIIKPWEQASQAQRDSSINGVLFRINNPHAGPDAQHDAWMADKLAAGWRFGQVKDEAAKTHPCLVPYEALPRAVQIKDSLFAGIVKAMSTGACRFAQPEPATTAIQPGEQNDPSVEIGSGTAAVTTEFRDLMEALGFKESLGSFVYDANGRGIWVNPKSSTVTSDITKQIVEGAEEIGKRHKINQIRKALDLPCGEVAVVKANHEHQG